MNELVSLMNDKVVTNSVIVAETFGKRHSDVIRAIETIEKDLEKATAEAERKEMETEHLRSFASMFIEDVDYDSYMRTRKIYIMNRQGWSLLVMGFNGHKVLDFKMKFIAAFDHMEEQLKAKFEPERPKLPMTYKEALLALVEAEEQKEAMQLQITEYQPKVEYHDTVLQSSKLVTVTNIAKDLGMGATTLNRLLHDKGIQYKKGKNWVLYAKYDRLITEGYADYHINEFGQTLKWTEKGRKWIIEQLQTQLAEVN